MSLTDQVTYAPKATKMQRFAVTITGARTLLTDAIKASGWIRVLARGASVQVNFGSVTDTIPVMDSVTQAEEGYHVANGTYHDFWITGVDTHILWGADGNGFVDIYRAGQERVKT